MPSNTSKLIAFAVLIISRRSGSTKVSNTIGKLPSRSAILLIFITTFMALSSLSIYGMMCVSNSTLGNCAKSECPKVSAVIAVPSDIKNTLRLIILSLGMLLSDMFFSPLTFVFTAHNLYSNRMLISCRLLLLYSLIKRANCDK